MVRAPIACVLYALSVSALPLGGCGGSSEHDDPKSHPLALRINEVVSNNEGVYVDELGQTDDYVELINASQTPIELGAVVLRDESGVWPLPEGTLEPGEVRLFWADDEPEQGDNHLPFKIARGGERLSLELTDGTLWDSVLVPALAEHHAWARFPDGVGDFTDCGWASPARENGPQCQPAEPPGLPEVIQFEDYAWRDPWPDIPTPLALTELALDPAGFIEIVNTTSTAVDLTTFELNLAPSAAGLAWPALGEGTSIMWPVGSLAPGERVVVPVSEADLAAIALEPRFEGVVTIWDSVSGEPVDRVDFDQWPSLSVLARDGALAGYFRYCEDATPGASSEACAQVASRDVPSHVRALRTPGDFDALAAGRARTGISGVEFLVDMQAGDRVSLLRSEDWDLHYLFVSEVIDGESHIDRCTPEGYAAFHQGWAEFSVEQYFRLEGRRYLLGNLVHHAGPGLFTVEFAIGDVIDAELMERAFFSVMRAVPNPRDWAIRPQDAAQVEVARKLEGRVPLIDPNAPYRNVNFQPLTPAVAYGSLRFVPAATLDSTALGPHDILVTDQVPNDLPFVAGLVTEAVQTPLSHVNVLSRARGTPSMFLRSARQHPSFEPLFDKLVRLEVRSADFSIRAANAEEALAFWRERELEIEPQVPRLDTSLRGPQPLEAHRLASLPAIGGKAAALAELLTVPLCTRTEVPERPFAVPVVHSLEHFAASGALARLAELSSDPSFRADPEARAAGLASVRDLILAHALDTALVDDVLDAIADRFPGVRLRFRSSSNAEDLASFSGAGLYDSVAWKPSEGRVGVENAIRAVWASLYSTRAYDERVAYRIDQSQVAMAVLVHPAYHHEAANGVIISRDVADPTRGDRYYVNAQIGEALVTNPAPGITSDQLAVSVHDPSRVVLRSESNLPGQHPVLSAGERRELVCSMTRVHDHFRAVLDPAGDNGWFAMDVEFKLMGPERQLAFKQARPYSFGLRAPQGWCDL